MHKTVFISGIDTDAGKSIVTGLMAKYLLSRGVNVITQKFIQTGNVDFSEDIEVHRKIMGIKHTEFDKNKTTCPYIFTYPASPHLAAEIDNIEIEPRFITNANIELEKNYDKVLLEGAGGLYVPITRDYYTIDYIKDYELPLVLVTSSKLGSINHTLMSLELCRNRGIELRGLIFNNFPTESERISEDSHKLFKKYLENNFPNCKMVDIPLIRDKDYPIIDFSSIL